MEFAGNLLGYWLVYSFLMALLQVGLGTLITRLETFHQIDPLERNLQRVSHSIAYIVGGLAAIAGYSPILTHIFVNILSSILTKIFGYSQDPRSWQFGILAAVLGVGLIRIRTGLRAFRFFNPEFHEHTTVLRAGAAVKTAIGLGGLVYLALKHDAYIYAGGWWVVAYETLGVIAVWCSVIGPVRLFLLRPRRTLSDPREPVEQDIRQREWGWD